MEISIKLEYARRVCNCIGLEAKEAVVESPRMEKKRFLGALPLISALPTTEYDVPAAASLNSRDVSDSPVLTDGDADLAAPFLQRGGLGPAVDHPVLSTRSNVLSKEADQTRLFKFPLASGPQLTDAMRQVQEAADNKAAAEGKRSAGRVLAHTFVPGQLGWRTIAEDPMVKSAVERRQGAAPEWAKVENWNGNAEFAAWRG
ncbi:hypothetical protein MCOR12_006468 [Pyricularia oryzae]|nr:hypothetical protein MCOR12_006468 [Pyricularia oryzae]